jgi:transposase-like protein
MTNIQRSFTTDCKLEAAQLVTEQGYSFAEASRSLGWKTPAEALNEYLKSFQQSSVATTG